MLLAEKTMLRREKALMHRTPAQIHEAECCYRCWVLTRDDAISAKVLLVLKLDISLRWSDHLRTLTHLIGEDEARSRLRAAHL